MIVATIVPLGLVLAVSDMAHLADLYAIGVVGAIATNLGATSTDRGLNLLRKERVLMFVTFLVMAAIEISLLVESRTRAPLPSQCWPSVWSCAVSQPNALRSGSRNPRLRLLIKSHRTQ